MSEDDEYELMQLMYDKGLISIDTDGTLLIMDTPQQDLVISILDFIRRMRMH